VVCVLGTWDALGPVSRLVSEVGGPGFSLDTEYSQLAPDARMGRAFEASADRVHPSFGEEDRQAVAEHRAVAYVLSPPLSPREAPELSARMLRLVAALLGAGGVAAKGESSGIAHGARRWRELAEGCGSGDVLARGMALRDAWVRRPLVERDGALYSCGMHLLGEPDVELPSELEPLEAVEWIDALGLYLLTEKPARGLRPGETFRPSAEHPRRVLRLRPCERYEEDDFFFNPYGYWDLRETR
jgi:hypothetical protein